MSNRKPMGATGDLPAGIGAPATRALNGAGFSTLKQLTKATEAELLNLHGFGPKALRIIVTALRAKGLTLAAPKEKRAT